MNAPQQPEIVVLRDAEELAHESARRFVKASGNAVAEHGHFRVALSGGSTPQALYRLLASPPYVGDVDWARVAIFFSDERFVPHDSDESNFGNADKDLFCRVPIPKENLHPVETAGMTPNESANRYEQAIRNVTGVEAPKVPAFDLILLGLGPDGHTASLFPDTDALHIDDRLVAPNYVKKLDTWRITFTYPLINAANSVWFLIQGAAKAERVGAVLRRDPALPASRITPESGQLLWLLDRAAASSAEVKG